MRYGGENRSRLLLITLIVTSLLLITLDLRGIGVIDGVRKGTQGAFAPILNFGATITLPVRNFLSDVSQLGRKQSQIKKLQDENDALRLQLLERANADAELEQLKSVLDLAGTAKFKVVAAKVISQGATTSFTQTITINAGTKDGIRDNMTVISGLGLVGVVKIAYDNSSLVELASDPGFKIGARIAGTQQIGILSGQGTRQGVLQLLDNKSTLKLGDVVLARGSQNNRPFVPGVPIGVVTAVDNAAGSVTQTADVRFFTSFSTLGVVSVVLAAPAGDPRDALVPQPPRPTPIPTVTVYPTPSESPKP